MRNCCCPLELVFDESPTLIDIDIGNDGTIDLGLSETIAVRGDPIAPYQGDYIITPKAFEEQIMPTNGLLMLDDVTVKRVPYYETTNPMGQTVYIASEV